ncbi:MAG: hypothetical protein E7316_07300 [Clostridiales bacterium]|nr:hypothetical protein [Clostridiales bacterium]
MFDVTPVDNLFILEHMPGAQGDHVKVYLYGLMQCYHPQESSIEKMGLELNMTEEEILAAYRYWERRGLVHRVSDRPPTFRYVNAKKLMFMDNQADPAYEAFAQAVHSMFDNKRKLYGKEVSRCYEWVEQMGLPQEVVLRLLERMIELRGPKFSFDSAEKRAVELAEAGARCAEDVDVVLDRDKKVLEGSRAVLRQFSIFREPTQAEMNLYSKWMKEWGYTPEAITAACGETTNSKQPSFKYLDGVLRDKREKIAAKTISAAQLEKSKQTREATEAPLRRLLGALNKPGVTVNESTLAIYAEMRALYTDDIILLAGKECAKRQCEFEDVLKTLKNWNKNGLRTAEQIGEYMQQVGQYNEFVDQLYTVWGKTSRSSAANRALVRKWTEEWNFTREMIVACAAYAREAERPMPYLNGVLDNFRKQGIFTPEAAAAAHAEHKPAAKPGKVVREQQYEQRSYDDEQALPEWMQQRLKEMNGDA